MLHRLLHPRCFRPLCAALLMVFAAAPVAARKPVPAAAPAADPAAYGRRADVMRFAAEAAEAHGLDRAWIEGQLAQARRLPTVQKLIMPPSTGTLKNWAAYRERFVEPRRIALGVDWWQANDEALRRAEEREGVPAEIIVAIVGVETFYGRVTGNFRVIDALATLAFDFPTGRSDRSGYFREELGHLLVLAARERRDATAYTGSYAGAMGLPQFMPGSILKFAVDFDDDGRIDLDRNPADVAGSVAHYLAVHGWQRGEPTHFEVTPPPPGPARAELLAPDILPTFAAPDFERLGAVLDDAGRTHAGKLALVELLNGGAAPSYLAGTQNFYAITRYNWSSYYALAVIELARTLKALRESQLR